MKIISVDELKGWINEYKESIDDKFGERDIIDVIPLLARIDGQAKEVEEIEGKDLTNINGETYLDDIDKILIIKKR